MPKKILLADDSLTIQKVVELTLADTDYQLTCVSSGRKALESLRESRPDLILADAVMPEKNGYEVCQAVKSDPATARIPVILLSGAFEPFDRDRAERIRCDLVVSKPVDAQQLLGQIEALLAGSGRAALPSPPEQASPETPEDRHPVEEVPAPNPLPGQAPVEQATAEAAQVLLDVPSAPLPSPAPVGPELTEEQIERIAARVVEKLSDRVVREIAWAVIPDKAELVIKRRIEELESGAE